MEEAAAARLPPQMVLARLVAAAVPSAAASAVPGPLYAKDRHSNTLCVHWRRAYSCKECKRLKDGCGVVGYHKVIISMRALSDGQKVTHVREV